MKSEVLVILINNLLALLDLQVHGLIPNYKIQLLHAMLDFFPLELHSEIHRVVLHHGPFRNN